MYLRSREIETQRRRRRVERRKVKWREKKVKVFKKSPREIENCGKPKGLLEKKRAHQPTRIWHIAMTWATPPLHSKCNKGGIPSVIIATTKKKKKGRENMTPHIPKTVLRWLDDHEIGRQLISPINFLRLDWVHAGQREKPFKPQ